MVRTETLFVLVAIVLAAVHVSLSARSRSRFHKIGTQLDEYLTYGKFLKGFVVFGGAFWLFIFLATTRGLRDLSGWEPSNLGYVLIILFAVVMPVWFLAVEVFGAEYHVTPHGLRKHSPWSRGFFAPWSEIVSVSYNPAAQWTVLHTTRGKVRIHDYLEGRGALHRALARNVPEQKVKLPRS